MIQSFQTLPQVITMDSQKPTTKQFQILQYLYRFRFLTSIQIQKLLNDKSTRITNYPLKSLCDKKYIDKHYTRKLGEGNQPAIYYLTTESIKALQADMTIKKDKLKYIYRERLRSKQFICNSLFIADYYLFLLTESSKTSHTLHFYTKSDLLAHPYIIHPLPDAYFARVDAKGETKRYFVEVIDEGAPRFTLRKRIEQYNDYVENGTFENATSHPFPTILFICPNMGIKTYLNKYLNRIFEESSLDTVDIYLATREEVFRGYWQKAESEEQ